MIPHHARLLKLGLDRDSVTATQLLTAYVTAHRYSPDSLTCARRLFDQVPSKSRDPVLWTALISSYARSSRPSEALRLFSHMLLGPARPNHFTLAAAAAAAAAASDAAAIHSQAVRLGLRVSVFVSTSLIAAYSKSDDLISARKMFDEMPSRNTVTWNSMISAYTIAGMERHALDLFYRMRCLAGCDEFSVAICLAACAWIGDLRSGAQIHGYALLVGLERDPVAANAVANMYFRCGEVEFAERALGGRGECVTSKIAMIKGYVFNERYGDALQSIGCGFGTVEMVMVDSSVVVSILTVCSNLGLLGIGKEIHGLIVTIGHRNLHSSKAFIGSALIDMYCKCFDVRGARCVFNSMVERHISHWNSMIAGYIRNGLLEEACRLFDEMPDKNVISWTTMISGYVQCGLPEEGLRLLAKLHGYGGPVRGNWFTFATALDACSCLSALELGKQIHAHILRTISDNVDRVVVETSLVDMYSKSGELSSARRVFDRMQKKNVVSWTSMISGYGAHGLGFEAITILEQMISSGYRPNEVTFVAVLSACSRCGLLEQGLHYFSLMRDEYGIAPSGDHYTCIVDMLGRAGKLVEARNLVAEMKGTEMNDGGGAAIRGALFEGCRLHGDVEIGSKVAYEMLERKHQVSDTYVALSNVYAAAEMWDKVYNVREEWSKHGVVKGPGRSQILG